MGIRIASLFAEIGADTTKLKEGLAEAKRQNQEYAKEAEKMTAAGADFRKVIPGIDDYIGRLKAATPENARMAMGLAEIDQNFKAGNITAKQATDQLEKLKAQYTTSESALHRFGGKLNEVVQGLTGFNVATLASVGGVIALAKGVRDSVDEYYNYTAAVQKMADSTGMGTEQISKIVQVADDFRVSQGTVETALKMALQNGFNPTIENLATLSDRYVSLQDPTARASEMQKIFGRQWAEMVPLLSAGGAAIRENAAAINDARIVTEKAAQAAKDYYNATDALGDAWTATKYNLAQGAIPALTLLINTLVKSDEAAKNSGTSWMRYIPVLNNVYDVAMGVKGAFDAQSDASIKAASKMTDQERAVRRNAGANHDAAVAMVELTDDEKKHYDQISQKSQVYNERAHKYRESIDKMVADQKMLDDKIKASYSDLKTITAGAFGKEDEDFKKTSGSIQKQIDETKAKIAELTALPYVSDEQQQEIDAQVLKLGDLQTKLAEATKAHETAMKTMAFNMLIERAASDGLTENEVNNMATIAVAWGLWDTKTAEVVGAVNKNMGSLDTKNPQQILDILNAIMGLPNEKYISVTTEYRETGTRNGKHGGAVEYAGGGSFVIPPGYNENYPLGGNRWASSGETVTVTPAGRNNKTGNNITYNIFTSSNPGTIQNALSLSRLMGGAA